jgi:hypothetical protein
LGSIPRVRLSQDQYTGTRTFLIQLRGNANLLVRAEMCSLNGVVLTPLQVPASLVRSTFS